jgi:hypothetical protein
MAYNPNQPETEQDGTQAEALRRLKVRRLLKAQPAQTPASSPSQSNTQQQTVSPSDGKPNTQK